MQGTVFNIQRFSLHDGPGIRTVVFLKGCPLRCLWCSNPESQLPRPELMYLERRCLSCGACTAVCPRGAIGVGDNGARSIDRDSCNLCGRCVEVCVAEALRWSGEKKSAEEVMRVIEADQMFFRNSGGGVTFSGGEALAQAEFVQELAVLCRAKGITTAIETSGYAEQKTIAMLAPVTDLWLYDLKHVDDAKHRLYTGVSNQPIIANLRYLMSCGARVIVRIPFIGGVNADPDTVSELIVLLRSIEGLREVHLLPYHELGLGKYTQLGRPYNSPSRSVAAEEVEEALTRFRDAGFIARNDGIKPRPRAAMVT